VGRGARWEDASIFLWRSLWAVHIYIYLLFPALETSKTRFSADFVACYTAANNVFGGSEANRKLDISSPSRMLPQMANTISLMNSSEAKNCECLYLYDYSITKFSPILFVD
jgi:hypothetical protein